MYFYVFISIASPTMTLYNLWVKEESNAKSCIKTKLYIKTCEMLVKQCLKVTFVKRRNSENK